MDCEVNFVAQSYYSYISVRFFFSLGDIKFKLQNKCINKCIFVFNFLYFKHTCMGLHPITQQESVRKCKKNSKCDDVNKNRICDYHSDVNNVINR